MIEKLIVKNFKSLDHSEIDFKRFNCLVGTNGAGKTTILQAIDFVAQQMHGDVSGWLSARGWDAKDLHCKTKLAESSKKKAPVGIHDIDKGAAAGATVFCVQYRLQCGKLLTWMGGLNRKSLKLEIENIYVSDVDNPLGSQPPRMSVAKGKLAFSGDPETPILFDYQGSILSQLRGDILPEDVREFRDALLLLRSLELLSPHLLRKRSRSTDVDIGAGGEKLSGYLDTIKGAEKTHLIEVLRAFYPRLEGYKVSSMRAGWKRLLITENHNGIPLETEAIHLNDGLLRILAVLAQVNSGKFSMVLLDEIENGINPEVIEKLVDLLVQTKNQVVVTTHSPMILNYLDDETARQSVLYVYKSPLGQTRIRPFFSLPRIKEKLEYMGPGEAFADTNLYDLTDEFIRMDDDEARTESSGVDKGAS